MTEREAVLERTRAVAVADATLLNLTFSIAVVSVNAFLDNTLLGQKVLKDKVRRAA